MKGIWFILMLIGVFTQMVSAQKSTFVHTLGIELPKEVIQKMSSHAIPPPLLVKQGRVEAGQGWTIFSSGQFSWVLKALNVQTRTLSMVKPEPQKAVLHGFIFCSCGGFSNDLDHGCEIELGRSGAFQCPKQCSVDKRTNTCKTAILYLHEDGTTTISYWNE